MKAKDKAEQILSVIMFQLGNDKHIDDLKFYKKIAVFTIKNEYYSNRELLYNLKASGFEISERVYLSRIQGLIDEEKEVIKEIKKIKTWEIL